MSAGARADARDGKGRGALHLAVGCSSKMVEKFLGLDAALEAADKRGRTPLHYSAAKGVYRQTLTGTALCAFCRYVGQLSHATGDASLYTTVPPRALTAVITGLAPGQA